MHEPEFVPTRYTLIYTCKDGKKMVLYNLLKSAVDQIIHAQTDLGSYDFAYEPQPFNYSQQEIDMLKGRTVSYYYVDAR